MRKADNLQQSCAVVTKSGSLNFLERSGPLQACNGTAFFFTCGFYYEIIKIISITKKNFIYLLILRHSTYARHRVKFYEALTALDSVLRDK